MIENDTGKLHGLLKSFSTVMLITKGGPVGYHARPMDVARLDENSDLWFFASRDSAKVREIEADSLVQVHGQDGSTFVVLTGNAAVVDDHAMVREFWKPPFKAWFPGGFDDPNIVLLHVKGEQAEYWDTSGVSALVTGPTHNANEDEQHGNVALPQ